MSAAEGFQTPKDLSTTEATALSLTMELLSAPCPPAFMERTGGMRVTMDLSSYQLQGLSFTGAHPIVMRPEIQQSVNNHSRHQSRQTSGRRPVAEAPATTTPAIEESGKTLTRISSLWPRPPMPRGTALKTS